VRAQGKHLLIEFADGRTLQTHLGMTGAWHLHRPRQPWRKPRHLVRAVIEVPDWIAVCFSAPTVRLLGSPVDVAAALGHLGPDLCTLDEAVRSAGLEEAVRRMATIADPDTDIADVLVDQRVAAGIGNVYKSEVLWACRLDPFTPVRSVPVEVRLALLEVATDQLRANLGPGRRVTVRGGLAVYGRARRPCRRCGSLVQRRFSGLHQRSTYWCPDCQRRRVAP
jgi:endonuclease-8